MPALVGADEGAGDVVPGTLRRVLRIGELDGEALGADGAVGRYAQKVPGRAEARDLDVDVLGIEGARGVDGEGRIVRVDRCAGLELGKGEPAALARRDDAHVGRRARSYASGGMTRQVDGVGLAGLALVEHEAHGVAGVLAEGDGAAGPDGLHGRVPAVVPVVPHVEGRGCGGGGTLLISLLI